METRRQHWESVWAARRATEMSWFQAEPNPSLPLIRDVLPAKGSVIDIGGGASHLVDGLLEMGCSRIAVLDVSAVALTKSQERLGAASDRVGWIVGDVTQLEDLGQFDLWHDRAVFHFLTDRADRRRYVDLALRTVPPDGHLILGTFGPQGPEQCSGLPTCRYDAAGLSSELGGGVELVEDLQHEHRTPWGKPQQFTFAVFRRR